MAIVFTGKKNKQQNKPSNNTLSPFLPDPASLPFRGPSKEVLDQLEAYQLKTDLCDQERSVKNPWSFI